MTQNQHRSSATPPNVGTLYYARERDHVTNHLARQNVGWEFTIGTRRLGDRDFRSEYPKAEIVAEYRPHPHDRLNRFAVYARKVAE